MNRDIFDEWLRGEGCVVFERELAQTQWRWLFGRARCRLRLYRTARMILKPGGEWAQAVSRRLDRLPLVIRKVGIFIKRRGHKDLFSADAGKALVVIPRALVQNDFIIFLEDEVGRHSTVKDIAGLARRALRVVAFDAEAIFFKQFEKGKQLLDDTGKSMLVAVDPEFGWKLNKVDGHYFYAYSGDGDRDLTRRGDRRKFESEMKEVLSGQQIYLKQLRSEKVAEIAGAFRGS